MADSAADGRRQAVGLVLDGVEGANPQKRLMGKRRAVGLVDVEELASRVRPAAGRTPIGPTSSRMVRRRSFCKTIA